MNFKTTYILFGILGALVLLLALVLWRSPTPTQREGYVLWGMHDPKDPLKPEDVTRVEIERQDPAGGTIVFERADAKDDWRITAPRSLRADNANVSGLVSQLYDAKRDEPARPKNFAEAGLDSPSRVITLSKGDRQVRLNVGRSTPGESGWVYVASSDSPKDAEAVPKRQVDAALKDLAYFRNHDLLGSNTSDVQELKLSDSGKKVVELKNVDGRWRTVRPPYGEADLGDLLNKLSDVRVAYKGDKDNDYVADGVTDLAKYNLDPAKKQRVLRIEVKHGKSPDAKTFAVVVGVGKKVGDKYYAFADEPGNGKDIVKVPASAVEPFQKLLDDPESLRSRTLVQFENFRQPDAIDIKNSYGELQFRRPDTGRWVLYRDGKAHAVDDTEVRQLVDKLTQKNQIQSFPDPKRAKELGLGKGRADATVTVWADALEPADKEEPKEEKDKKDQKDKKDTKAKKSALPKFKKDAKPAAVLRFGHREKKSVAVERKVGDDTTLAMVPEDLLDVVRKGPLAYFDRSLPMFNSGGPADKDVTRLVIDRDGTTYEMTREKSEAPWKIAKPKALAGRDANARVVEDILGRLNRLRALEVVAEKPEAAELEKYGLKSPSYKAVVTVGRDNKKTDTEFAFGKESPDKKGVYARVTGKDAVYVVGSNILEQLKKDLQDPTVLSFDVDKVQSLRLRGWQQLRGVVDIYEFARKDGKWVAMVPANFKVNSAKVDEFLRSLSHLRAERFVSVGEGRKPEQQLKLAQGALIIEITVEGKKEPLKLTVGGVADKDKSYYADYKQLGKDVFTVPQSLFKDAKEKPAYFSNP